MRRWICAIVVAGCWQGAAWGQRVEVVVDAGSRGEVLRHVWQYYGYDECNYTTAADAKGLMETLSRANPEQVYLRQHYLLASGDGTAGLKWGSTNVYTEDAEGNPVYDWRIMDGIMDAIVGAGCLPLVEIGFMPQDLSVRREPYRNPDPFNHTGYGVHFPPKDYEKWAELIRRWVKHSAERYPDVEAKWIWELWNEPNIRFWQGSFEEYCKLFDYTERAVHGVLPEATFGGPHTAGAPGYLRDFLEHCRSGKNYVTGEKGTRLDYVSFHSKGRTAIVDGHVRMDLGRNLRTNRQGFSIVGEFDEYRGKPIVIGECDPEGTAARSARTYPPNAYRNGSIYAAYEVALMKHTVDLAEQTGVNLQGVLTWAFMFDGMDYFEGFRTLSTNGIDKPVLNGFKMLGMLRGRRVGLDSSGALGLEAILDKGFRGAADVDGLATATAEGAQVLLWNYHDDMVDAEAAEVELTVKVTDKRVRRARVAHWRVDEEHSNAHTVWVGMGRPQKPTAGQIAQLKAAGQLELLEPIGYVDVTEGRVNLEFELPRHAVSLIELVWGP